MTSSRNFLGRMRERKTVGGETERNCFVQSCQILKHEINIKRAAVTAEKQQQEKETEMVTKKRERQGE